MKKWIIAALIAPMALLAFTLREITPRIEFDALETYPEGVAFDQANQVYYVSSARLAQIGKVTPAGSYQILHQDTTLKSSYGLKLHPDGKKIFACISDANYSKYTNPATRMKMARLISVDVQTGKRLSDVDLSKLVPGKHFANDLTFDDQQNIYVTDSFAGAVYKVTPNGQASLLVKDDQFKTEGVGLNGIVYHPNGYLIVDNSSKGQLYKINLANPKQVQRIGIDRFFLGADGLLLEDANNLIVVVNGGTDKIFRLNSADDWKTAKITASTPVTDRFTYPSTATKKGSEIWVMNAQFSNLVDSNAVPVKRFAIQQAILK